MPPLIETVGLTKRYDIYDDGFYALDHVNFKVSRGEFIAVLGPSGSGKSTLMNLIGGLDTADSGQLFINGRSITEFSQRELSKYRRKYTGFIFQSFNLNGSLTSLENVMLPLVYAGIGKARRREMALKALESVGLKERAYHRPGELSGGQRQRVSIARALVNQPEIILADEPTGNLDSASGGIVMELLSEINSRGYTVIMVTHNPSQATLASRVIEICDGRIIRDENQS